MNIDPVDFQGLLQAACDAYCTSYFNKYNMYPSSGRDCTHKSYKVIARLCVDHDINITDYIPTCFYLVEKERRYITPTDFAKMEFIDRYKDFKKRTKPTLSEHEFEMQRKSLYKLLLQNKLLYTTEEEALINIGTPFSSWFRVIYPVPFNEELYKYYGQLAWKELQADKGLRIYLRKTRKEQVAELERRIAIFGDNMEET